MDGLSGARWEPLSLWSLYWLVVCSGESTGIVCIGPAQPLGFYFSSTDTLVSVEDEGGPISSGSWNH